MFTGHSCSTDVRNGTRRVSGVKRRSCPLSPVPSGEGVGRKKQSDRLLSAAPFCRGFQFVRFASPEVRVRRRVAVDCCQSVRRYARARCAGRGFGNSPGTGSYRGPIGLAAPAGFFSAGPSVPGCRRRPTPPRGGWRRRPSRLRALRRAARVVSRDFRRGKPLRASRRRRPGRLSRVCPQSRRARLESSPLARPSHRPGRAPLLRFVVPYSVRWPRRAARCCRHPGDPASALAARRAIGPGT